MVTLALGQMQLQASRVMDVTTHMSEKQMRNDYMMSQGNQESRAATTRLVADYASGISKRMPPTSHEQFNAIRKDLEQVRGVVMSLSETTKQLVNFMKRIDRPINTCKFAPP